MTAAGDLFALPVGSQVLLRAPLRGFSALVNGAAVRALQVALAAPARSVVAPELRPLLARLLGPVPPAPGVRRGPFAPALLGLLPTRACNLACGYCRFGAARAPLAAMDPGLAEAAVDWAAEAAHRAGRRDLTVHFFGGEPLLAPAPLEAAVRRGRRAAERLGLSVRFEASTNGVCDPARARWAAEQLDAVVLSLDGPADLHDRQRPRSGGGGSFAAAAATAAALRGARAQLCIRSCVTAEGVERLPDTARFLCETFRPSVLDLEALRPGQEADGAGLLPPDPYRFAARAALALRVAESLGVKGVHAAASLDGPRGSICQLGQDGVIVAADGRLVACYLPEEAWRRRGLDLELGRIGPGGAALDPDALERVRAVVAHRPRCERCFCRFACAGGCHVARPPPGSPPDSTRTCLQTRLLTAARLLDDLGARDAADALLSDRGAMEALALQPSDLLPLEQRPAAASGTPAAPAPGQNRPPALPWAIPYVDQPASFWEEIVDRFGDAVEEVYAPLPGDAPSGRPPQPQRHLEGFLRDGVLPASVLLNGVVLARPGEEVGPAVIEALRRLEGDYGVSRATVASLPLARRIREALPGWRLTASTLLDVTTPLQAAALAGVFDALVPSPRVMRDLEALHALRQAFPGRVRLLVNEACLPDCLERAQHFFEMGSGLSRPRSLCDPLLSREPWRRLTGAWVLPQHLHLFAGVCQEAKLAGRVTLRDPARYLEVLGAYVLGTELQPHQIGGGPASPLEAIPIDEAFYAHTLRCGQRCHACDRCRRHWERHAGSVPRSSPQRVEPPPTLADVLAGVRSRVDVALVERRWAAAVARYGDGDRRMPAPPWAAGVPLEGGATAWSRIGAELAAGRPSAPISIYIHVPFCRGRCAFCDCYAISPGARRAELEERFVRALLAEVDAWGAAQGLGRRPVTTIHLGGGTPSALSSSLLEALVARLRARFAISPQTEWALESTSTLLSRDHLAWLRDLGFTRLHVGVQTLADPLRRALGRRERCATVLDKLGLALAHGFVTTVDLLYGLPGHDVGQLLADLDRLAAHGIHGFSLYRLNRSRRNRRFLEGWPAFRPDVRRDFALLAAGDEILSSVGFRKNHFAHWARAEDRNLYFTHRSRGEDLVALGPSADGRIGTYRYRHGSLVGYLAGAAGAPPLEGGRRDRAEAADLASARASVLGGAPDRRAFEALGLGALLDGWRLAGLVEGGGSAPALQLSASGSYFVAALLDELGPGGSP